MISSLHRHGRSALAAAALLAAGAACRPDRATVFDPAGENSYDFRMTVNSAADAALPGGTVAVTRRSTGTGTVVATLTNLNRLSGGVYKVWSGTATDDGVTDVVPLTGTVAVITTTDDGAGGTLADTATTAGASTFSAGGSNVTVKLTADAASFGSDPAAAARNVVFVSIESSEAATTPSSAQPLWAIYTAAAPTGTATSKTTTTALTFGTFAPKLADRYVYFLNGRGKGGVRGTTIIADDSALARPPVGYYYAAYIVGNDAETGATTDTLYLGELTAPYPRRNVSLRDADVNASLDPVVSTRPPVLTAASVRFDGTTKGLKAPLPYEGFTNLIVALQAKLGATGELPPNMILVGTLPEKATVPPATTTP